MIAFDTNLLVRLSIDDNPKQADIAQALLENHQVFISCTVLLETEWVLRSFYKINPEAIAAFFEAVLLAENSVIENHEHVQQALQWFATGADFANALHLALSGSATLYTFDQKFCKAARTLGVAPYVEVLKTS